MDELVMLRRRIRRLECLAIALLAGCGTVTVAGWRSPDPGAVDATVFRLLDADGCARGLWRITDDGSTALSLYDEAGRSRVVLNAAPSGASEVVVSNPAGAIQRLRIETDARGPEAAAQTGK